MNLSHLKTWTLSSQSPLKVFIDLIVLSTVLLALIEGPYRYLFKIPLSGYWSILHLLSILFFTLHFIISFRTTYWWRGEEINDTSRILKRNFRPSVIFDILPILPLELLFPFAPQPVLFLFFIIRVSKVFHFWQFGQIIRNIENLTLIHPIIIRMVLSLITIFVISHWVALGWLSVSHNPLDNKVDNMVDALYWSVTTLTTVGYGDITPETNSEKIYTMIIMFMGVGMYGYIIGNIASLLARWDSAKRDHIEKLERIISFMRYKQIPLKTQKRVRHYYFYLWETKQSVDYHSVLHELPPSIYTELATHLNQDLLQKVPLFREASPQLLTLLASRMRPMVFHAGESIFEKGMPGEAMYFILRGRVLILNSEQGGVLAELGEGNFFGEMSLFQNTPRTRGVEAIDFCELYVLERNDFEHAIERFPELSDKIHQTIKDRQVHAPHEV